MLHCFEPPLDNDAVNAIEKFKHGPSLNQEDSDTAIQNAIENGKIFANKYSLLHPDFYVNPNPFGVFEVEGVSTQVLQISSWGTEGTISYSNLVEEGKYQRTLSTAYTNHPNCQKNPLKVVATYTLLSYGSENLTQALGQQVASLDGTFAIPVSRKINDPTKILNEQNNDGTLKKPAASIVNDCSDFIVRELLKLNLLQIIIAETRSNYGKFSDYLTKSGYTDHIFNPLAFGLKNCYFDTLVDLPAVHIFT